MTSATYHIGDVFDVMATLPDASVDLVLTSPPFLALRSYLPDDHPDKAREIGSEPTPAEFLDTLLALTAEWDRLLAPHGSICVELGDTYAGGGGLVESREHRPEREGTSADGGARTVPLKSGDGWPLDKSLCGIPTLYAWSLAYGRNLLTGEESPAGRWRIRNVVAWCRPNPPVGALGDKFRPATSYITIATKARDRWFDLDAVRDGNYQPRSSAGKTDSRDSARAAVGLSSGNPGKDNNPAGAPPLDYWEVTTEPYSGSHYATWPRKLLTRPIESMCPKEVCRTCGEPRRRIVDVTYEPHGQRREEAKGVRGKGVADGEHAQHMEHGRATRVVTGSTWTDCGHDDYRRGIVLDPFAGSGTTLAVATGLGRDAVGIDLDSRNADLAAARVGMFLEVAPCIATHPERKAHA